jgi:hypothetical protein
MTEESGSIYMQQAPAPDADGKGPGTGPVSSDSQGNWEYPSTVHEGMLKVDLPLKNRESGKETESILVKNFGSHVATKTEAQFKRLQGLRYLNEGPHDPQATLGHYAGVARGLGLLDERSISQMENLSRRMAASSEPERFFVEQVRPFLVNLRPGRRQP